MALTKIGKEGITGISNSADATFLTATSGEGVTLAGTLAVTGVHTVGENAIYDSEGGAVTQNLVQSLCKCWWDYDQDNTAVRDSFNTSSVTDVSAGNYAPQWSNNMGSVNYATMSATQPQSTAASCESFEDGESASYKSVSATRIQTIENGSATDHINNGGAIFGDLA